MAKNITKERLALAEKCLDEGWSFIEITRTYGITGVTLRRHFPGRGWSLKESAKLGNQVRRMTKNMTRV